MKTISPWFRTANLIDGIRKAYSDVESTRGIFAANIGKKKNSQSYDPEARDSLMHRTRLRN